jgi:transcriptional antiterminator RfaH
MPVCELEPALYPDDLFSDDGCPDVAGHDWYVVHTLPRQEKALARMLCEEQVPFFLPLISRRWRCRGREITSYLPLFTGYLFLAAPDRDFSRFVWQRAVRVLAVHDQERLASDLRQVHRLIASGAPLAPEERLQPGMTVEICGGPLAGVRGKIIRSSSGRRFVVDVDFIRRGVSALLDDYLLEAVAEV